MEWDEAQNELRPTGLVKDFQYRLMDHMEEEEPSHVGWGCVCPNFQDLLPGGRNNPAVGDVPTMREEPTTRDKPARHLHSYI